MFQQRVPTVAVTDFSEFHDRENNAFSKLFIDQGFERSDDVSKAGVVIASVFGRSHWKAQGSVVMVSQEAYTKDALADYTIDCRFLPRANHLRLPVWASLFLNKPPEFLPAPLENSGERFCNFIFSNRNCPERNAFFEMLHARTPVDALGSVMNNTTDPRLSARYSSGWQSGKIDVLRDYRFTIAFENREMLGYTTEKMIDAWLAGSVPIYWGNPGFTLDFPPDSCLSLYEAGSMHRLMEQVLEAEREPERYAQLQAANPFRTGHAMDVVRKYQREVAEFCTMVAKDVRHPTRRTIPQRKARFLALTKERAKYALGWIRSQTNLPRV